MKKLLNIYLWKNWWVFLILKSKIISNDYERSSQFRDPDTDALIGYIHFEEGTFNLNGLDIDFIPIRNLFIWHEEFWDPFEELQEWEVYTHTPQVTSTLEYREGGT